MNLYMITLRADGLGRQSYHVSAKDARKALDKAYAKCRKELKGLDSNGHMYVQTLELVQEGW